MRAEVSVQAVPGHPNAVGIPGRLKLFYHIIPGPEVLGRETYKAGKVNLSRLVWWLIPSNRGSTCGTLEQASTRGAAWCVDRDLLVVGRALALFDVDHLATAVLTAGWADVVRQSHGAAVRAGDKLWCRDEVMAAAIALVGPANALLGKCTHRNSPSCEAPG